MDKLLKYMKDINETFKKCIIVFQRNYIYKNPSNKFNLVSKFISRISVKELNICFCDHPNKYKCFGTIWKMFSTLKNKNSEIEILF